MQFLPLAARSKVLFSTLVFYHFFPSFQNLIVQAFSIRNFLTDRKILLGPFSIEKLFLTLGQSTIFCHTVENLVVKPNHKLRGN